MYPLLDFVNAIVKDIDLQGLLAGSFLQKNTTILDEENLTAEKKYRVAVIGLPDTIHRSSFFKFTNAVRKRLYALTELTGELDLLDIGNIKPGNTFTDTCYAISEVFTYFSKLDIILLHRWAFSIQSGMYFSLWQ